MKRTREKELRLFPLKNKLNDESRANRTPSICFAVNTFTNYTNTKFTFLLTITLENFPSTRTCFGTSTIFVCSFVRPLALLARTLRTSQRTDPASSWPVRPSPGHSLQLLFSSSCRQVHFSFGKRPKTKRKIGRTPWDTDSFFITRRVQESRVFVVNLVSTIFSNGESYPTSYTIPIVCLR